ncbi:dynamin family protein [Metabacillus iocasae]|uniref:GTPase SAR1 family protein n=1 Tax=Priestia iocasae TaxID=2291674 RepID=A0ABS2QUE6_9BACI|nr:dynamin family protein [Metabacillus iocasae]MBM7702346.1 GTPase SAR1 family protein [Metabacillus iocasae]
MSQLSLFQEKKGQVIKQLMRLDKLTEDMNLRFLSKQLTDTILAIHREEFEIIVVGEFSNGKSTFVNALLGKEILPASVRPTTAILNKVYYNEKRSHKLFYRNSKFPPKEINEELFKKIIAPSEPIDGDENTLVNLKKSVELIKSIDHAEIGYPVELCKNDIVLIDSPGTNDLDPDREAITNHYIPKSDAAIIVLNATRALSESEVSFLRDRVLSADINKIFFVINFKDLLRKDGDLEKVYQYVKKELSGIVDDPRLFFVSSRHALLQRRLANGEDLPKQRRPLLPLEQTGFQELERELLDFLQYERGAVKLEKPINRGLKVSREILDKHIPFERLSLNNNITNLQEQSQQLRQQLDDTRRIGNETAQKIQWKITQEGSNIKNWYEKELYKIADSAEATLQHQYYQGCNVDTLRRSIESTAAPLERNLHEEFKKEVEKRVSDVIQVESQQLENAFSAFDDRFVTLLSESSSGYHDGMNFSDILMNHTGKITAIMIASTIISSFWLLPGALLISGLFVIGGFIFDGIHAVLRFITGRDYVYEKLKKEINHRFRANIPEKVRQFNGKWSDVAIKVTEQYKEIINEQIEEKENQLMSLIRNNQMSTQEINTLLAKLDEQEKEVQDIMTQLEGSHLKMTVGV